MKLRYALLSDIHGNLAALDAVLADLADWPEATMLELGDTLYGPLDPRGTWLRLLEESESRRVIGINGNQDREVIARLPSATMDYVHEQLGSVGVEWLRRRPANVLVDNLVYICHGKPGDDGRYWLEDLDAGLRALGDINADAAGIAAEVLVCGHSHIPRAITLPDGRMIINPGSVGLPAFRDQHPTHAMQTGAPLARYARIEATDRGWLIDHRAIPYDHELAVEQALDRDRLDWAQWLSSGWA
ncbi:DNA methylase [Jeongeupia sp. HS-3]|uniref:metallophosphoesterase family protein n=1 Tax=Jeongeupia sp. HS-3 TaxID=1009682 RepID=UPI0018A5FFF3|nr:metallophosphoesterase family protein [Jeongeupia sp. HS-3]BCL76276.1 DNA methylase [Jeongeupia sp. HS-3]